MESCPSAFGTGQMEKQTNANRISKSPPLDFTGLLWAASELVFGSYVSFFGRTKFKKPFFILFEKN
jgi:hypothetical protein